MKTRGLIVAAILSVLVVGLAASVGHCCFMYSPQPVSVWLDHITVDITDQVAVKTYNCTFKNPNARAVVGGMCYMELEPGAQIDDMSVLVDGKEMKAEILDVEKAKKVFTDIVRRGGSPALLEYYGNQLVQTQVPRIPPNGTVTVKLKYTTVLKARGDLVRLQMLNTNPKALMQPLKAASVTVNIRSKTPIKNVYSPTHKIKIGEKEGWDLSISWSQENYLPKHPFVLYYQLAEEKLGASLIAHRDEYEDGSFMLMLSPTVGSGAGRVTEDDILPKDVVFCVDTSGSMLEGKKIDQAKEALQYCVKSLRPGDRFNIVDFSTGVRNFSDDGLVELTDRNRGRALGYVSDLYAGGGTAIDDALEQSLKDLGDSERLKMILFATDGLPTIGERNPESILRNMAKRNTRDVRLFVFGEGFDVNTTLLDFLAINHRGESDYIQPNEDIKVKIAHFFDRVGSPIMTDLKVEFEGIQVRDVFPRQVADIYRGEQVIVYGRYTSSGTHTVKLSGMLGGQRQTFTYSLDFPSVTSDDRNAFVERLWGGKKVDFLLSELRKHGTQDKELVEEVTKLAKRYGIVTPYTSFLMADDIVTQGLPQLATKFRGRFNAPGFGGGKLGAPAPEKAEDKKAAFDLSKELSDLRRKSDESGAADAYYEAAQAHLAKNGKDGSSLAAIRYIGSKTFYKSGDVWYDSRFDSSKDKVAKTVKVGSDEYIELLAQDTRIAKYLALGNVVLKAKGTWYRVST